jgi:hypothetical protein
MIETKYLFKLLLFSKVDSVDTFISEKVDALECAFPVLSKPTEVVIIIIYVFKYDVFSFFLNIFHI